MSKDNYDKLKKLFNAQFDDWCERKLDEYNGDYDQVSREMCQIMNDYFWTPPREMSGLIRTLSPKQIETILIDNLKAGNYTFRQEPPNDLSVRQWVLTKRGGHRRLYIFLMKHNYIYLAEYTKDHGWSMNAFSLGSFENAILSWAENRM